jgi:hypothetical protein
MDTTPPDAEKRDHQLSSSNCPIFTGDNRLDRGLHGPKSLVNDLINPTPANLCELLSLRHISEIK